MDPLLKMILGLGGPMQPPIYPGQFPGNDAFGAPGPQPLRPPQMGGNLTPPIYPGQYPGNDAFGAQPPTPPSPPPEMLPPQDPGGLAGTGSSGMIRPGSAIAQIMGLFGPGAQPPPAFPGADAFGVGMEGVPSAPPAAVGFDDTGLGAPQGPSGMSPFDDTGLGAPGGPPGVGGTVPAVPPTTQPQPMNTQPVSLGQSLEPGAPKGVPMDIRSVNQKRMDGNKSSVATNPQQSGAAQRIMQALKGVQAPAKPDVVKPTTPAAPAAGRPIQAGGLLELINSLSNPRAPIQRPTTLGGALGTGRY